MPHIQQASAILSASKGDLYPKHFRGLVFQHRLHIFSWRGSAGNSHKFLLAFLGVERAKKRHVKGN